MQMGSERVLEGAELYGKGLCVCMCVYVCVCVRMYVYTYVCVRACVRNQLHFNHLHSHYFASI